MPFCTHCGTANAAVVQYCKSCGSASPFNVNGVAPAVPAVAPAPVVSRELAAAARLPLKSPLGAALLSWLWPGLGHCYAGRPGSGAALIVVGPLIYYPLLLIAAFTLDPLPLIVLFVIALAVAHGAARSAREVNAIRMHARATVRAARGAGYASQSFAQPLVQPPVQLSAMRGQAPGTANNTPREWPPMVFVCVCAIVLIAVLLSSFA